MRVLDEVLKFGTPVENAVSYQLLTAMIANVQRYLNLKRQAMQFMLNGDVERYMRALRLISRLAVR